MTATPATTTWCQKMWRPMKEDEKMKAKEVTTAGVEVVGSRKGEVNLRPGRLLQARLEDKSSASASKKNNM